jgi:hypothetical protein
LSERARIACRVLLAWTALTALFPGVWATIAPRGFFTGFPGFGLHWVDRLGPLNLHMTADVGAFYLAFALLLGWAAWRPSRELVLPVCVAWSLFSLVHAAWHAGHLEGWSVADGVAQTFALVAVLAAPLVVIALARRDRLALAAAPS